MRDLVADPAAPPPPAPRRRLRELLAAAEADGPVAAPGAYDALSARLVEAAGFDAVYMTGFGAAASLLGRPDVGLLTMTEMAGQAQRIAAAVDVPVIADADTGYGSALNVVRTVGEYERAGVAAIQLEDQVAPKRCGHMDGKAVIDPGEMAAKVRAAVAARTDPDLVVIARTDARAVEGVEAAIERARRCADAGADLLFVEALATAAEIERVADALAGHALVFNWAEGGRTPPLPLPRIAALGFRLVIFPLAALLAAAGAVRETVGALRADGTPAARLGALPSFDEICADVGLPELRALERRLAD